MNKKALLGFISLVIIVLSCRLISQQEQDEKVEKHGAISRQSAKKTAVDLHAPDKLTESAGSNNDDEPVEPIEPRPEANPDGLIASYDTKELDRRLVDMAKSFREDPATFRMGVRNEPDGAQIYRELGMFVIVNPRGDEVFLPDEI